MPLLFDYLHRQAIAGGDWLPFFALLCNELVPSHVSPAPLALALQLTTVIKDCHL